MKRRTPRGVWALRSVTLVIALAVVLVIGTLAYSAYEDYSAIRPELAGGSNQVVGRGVTSGNTYTVSIDIPIPNRGLYTLNVTVACVAADPNVVCAPAKAVVPAGQTGNLSFRMTVLNMQEYTSSGDRRINGTIDISLEPFATVAIGVDLSGYVKGGGA